MAKETNYKSPVSKLVRFFESSRDAWKEKHHEVKKALSWPNLLFEMSAYVKRHYGSVVFLVLVVQ